MYDLSVGGVGTTLHGSTLAALYPQYELTVTYSSISFTAVD